jgi:hypothetical protein
MGEPVEVDVSKIIYYNSDGTVQTGTGSSKSDSKGGGVFGNILGAIPGILSSLFPNGIGGNNNTPIVSTMPNGDRNVQLQGNNNILMYALVLMVGFMLFTGMRPIQPQPKKR